MKKIDFQTLQWDESAPGFRAKTFEKNGKKIRLAEISREFLEPDRCEKAHTGFVLEGELEIDFEGEKIFYQSGDALFVEPGTKHSVRSLSEKVLLFLVEEI